MLVVFTVIDKSRESYLLNKRLKSQINGYFRFNELIRFILNPDGDYSLVAEYKAVALEAGVQFSLVALFSIDAKFVSQRGALQC